MTSADALSHMQHQIILKNIKEILYLEKRILSMHQMSTKKSACL